MTRLIELLRSLGNAGAVANAKVLLDEHQRERWLVASLARRVDRLPIAAEPHAA